jgi:CHAT domain-containing protein
MPQIRVPRRYLRWVVLIAWSVCVTCAMPSKAASQTAPTLPGELLAAYAEKRDGKVLSAIQRLQRSLGAMSRASLSREDRWTITVELLYMCRSVVEVECLNTYTNELSAIHEDSPAGEEPRTVLIRLQTIFLFRASLAFLTQDIRIIHQALADGMLGREQGILDARVYIDRQLLLARYHLFLGDPELARLAIDRALTLVLSISDLREWGFWVAQWLSETIELLQASGDIIRAYGIYSSSNPFILATFPRPGLEYVEYKIREMTLLHTVVQLAGARNAAEEARQTTELLELPPQKRLFLHTVLAIVGTIVCLSAESPECVDQFLALHPLAREPLPPELAQLRDFPQVELPFLVLSAMIQAARGREIPAAWAEKLREAVSPERVPHSDTRELLEGLRNLALALALARGEPVRAGEAAVTAARMAVRASNRLLGSTGTAVPLVPLLNKLILVLTARPVFEGALQGAERITLALQMIEVMNRNIRHADADAYVRLAMAETEEDRRLLHAASRLAARHTEAELKRLRELITMAALGEPVSAAAQARLFDFAVRGGLTSYEKERLAIWDKLTAGGRLVLSRLELPQEEQVRSVLAADEVLVAVGFALDQMYHVCLKQADAAVRVATVDAEQVLRDIRIVSEALTAGHVASAELDSEYPAEAAVRLYSVLIRPVEHCIHGARHVVFVPPAEAIGFPIGALLRQMPPRRTRGYDLGAADWVGVKFGVSYVTSVRGFVAARRLVGQRWPSLDFLGVGDPVLSGYTDDGTPREVAVSRRSANREGRGLRALSELPESSAELTAVASLFPGGQTLLLREKASESRVRREALGQYRILDFATHGLIKDDTNGLTEAALVLTPQSETDTLNDGLLTASEIADLSLNAEMAVLSACNTARYDLGYFGVEVQGMATAFAIAGVPRVVATLWPIESKLAEQMMVRFFSDVRNSPQPDAAESLRLAMSEALSDARGTPYAHPRFWAAFAVFGDGRSMRGEPKAKKDANLILRRTGRLEPTKEGEVLGVVTVPGSRDVVISGFADPVDGVYQRTVARLGADGEVRWIYQDRTAAGADIISSPDGIYFAGYSLENQEYRPLVTKLRHDGHLEWTRILPSAELKGSTANRLMYLPGGKLLIVASPYRIKGDQNVEKQITLLELTTDGTEIRRSHIDLGTGMDSGDIRIAVLGDRLVVVTNEQRSAQGKLEWDVYDDPRFCSFKRVSTVYVLDVNSFSLKAKGEHPGIEIRAMRATPDGRVVATGSLVSDCATVAQSQLMVAEVREDSGLRVIFSDQESYRSRGMGLFTGPNGTYFVVGQSDRVFDIQRRLSLDEMKDFKFSPEVIRQKDRVELRDALVFQFDSQGKVINRSIVSGGVSFALTSGAYVDGRAIAAGSFGFEWGWVEYEVR